MTRIGLLLGLVGMLGGAALAEEKGTPATAPQMTAEQRSKMADAHEKIAACLRSDRSIGECHEEMMKCCGGAMNGGDGTMKCCDETKGARNCAMMGGMGSMKHQHGQTK